MIVRLWGTRGSLASSGPETAGYGGNTASVEIVSADGTILALDAGTGIRRLGAAIDPSVERLDILLTHLHMDHIQGLGFFAPFFRPSGEIHVWGPASATMDLRTRLTRYLSPPLFPVRIRDLDARVVLHDAPEEPVSIGGFEVVAQHVIHPGPTVGYRISADGASVAYLPDHEPALGARQFPEEPRWTSGFDLASGVDLLIHDGQYSDVERAGRIGWGHSSVNEAVAFAELAKVRRLILFHHDPSHSDAVLDELTEAARARATSIEVVAGREGARYDLGTAFIRSRAPVPYRIDLRGQYDTVHPIVALRSARGLPKGQRLADVAARLSVRVAGHRAATGDRLGSGPDPRAPRPGVSSYVRGTHNRDAPVRGRPERCR